MSWQNQLKGNSLSWLLEPNSPGVRYLALRDLIDDAKDSRNRCCARSSPPGRSDRDHPGRDERRRILGKRRSWLQPQVSFHRLGADHAGPAGRIYETRRAHRIGLFVLPGSCARGRRTNLGLYGSTIWYCGLFAGQHVLGAGRARLQQPAPWTWPTSGWRAP